MMHKGSIVVLDFGGQYAHLIGNRVRRLGAYSEVRVAETKAADLKDAAGIILSGGPQSVYDKGSPQADKAIFDLGIPILGICYGHQWIAHALGGKVQPGETKEYGAAEIEIVDGVFFERPDLSQARSRGGTSRSAESLSTPPRQARGRSRKTSALFEGLPKEFTVWMSHGDEVTELPEGFTRTASSLDCTIAAMENPEKKIFGTQFHLEVTHTEHGMAILKKFVDLCRPAPWSFMTYFQRLREEVKREVGDRNVFMLVSGGVDSTVAFTLLNEVLGHERVQGLLIDTGLMRKNEVRAIMEAFRTLDIKNLRVVDASDEFFKNLRGVRDPEEKRRIIGDTFLAVQKRVSEEMGLGMRDGPAPRSSAKQSEVGWMLGQGTIYPDTIETGGTKHADQIKTHHNRVPAVQALIEQGLVIEPLKELYKDEVRALGEELGLPRDLVSRHPFPGPGLAVRMLCAEKEEPCALPLKSIDVVSSIYAFRTLPLRSVGVQGDGRTYRHALAIFMRRAVTDLQSLFGLATAIPNTVPEINRMLFCSSGKEPVDVAFTPMTITKERVTLLQEADAMVEEEMRQANLYEKIWQFPVVLLPIGKKRGNQSIVLRPVASEEAMTANAYHLPVEVLGRMTQKLLTLPGIDLVFYDLTNKPPATIEWE